MKKNSNKYGKSAFASLKSLVVALFCLLAALPATAQLRAVQGTVVDQAGDPLVGASVRVTGATRSTITDASGVFRIEASSSEILTISYMGYQDAVIPADRTSLTVTMQVESQVLDDVVFTGYGSQAQATLSGSIATLSSEDLVVTKNENVVNMMSGKMPGVRVVQRTSAPGTFDSEIDIRGLGGAFVVVDGIPRDAAYLARMNPNEIESTSVLKDASAAIYGIRASGGVFVVTTKRGGSTDGKFNIELSANLGWDTFMYIPETAGAIDHMMIINEKVFNNMGANYPERTSPKYTWQQMLEYTNGKKASTNWTRELFNMSSPQRRYNVTMDGGTDKISYFFNLGYQMQGSAYKSGSYNYHNWDFRNNTDIWITKRLKASISLSGNMSERNQPQGTLWDVYKKAWTYLPTAEVWIDGDHDLPAYDQIDMLEPANPAASTDSRFSGYSRNKGINFQGSLRLEYDIPGVQGLKASGFYNYNYGASNNTDYTKTYYVYQRSIDEDTGEETLVALPRNETSTLRRSTDPNYNELMLFQLDYKRRFGDHNVSAFVAFEQQYGFSDGFYAQRIMQLAGEHLLYGEADDQQGGQGGLNEWARQSVLGQLHYDFRGRYIADFTLRNDASSGFQKEGRWGLFPAGSIAWRISEEPFVKQAMPFMSDLKLKVSYGVMGNDNGRSSREVQGYQINRNDNWFFGGNQSIGMRPTATPNMALTWFTSRMFNVGLDFGFFGQRLTGTAEFYRRVQSGLMADSGAQVPDEVGAALPQVNMNKDSQFGWDLSLGWRDRVGDLSYGVSGNIMGTKGRWIFRSDTRGSNSLSNWRGRTTASGRNKDIWMNDREEAGRFTSFEQIRNHPLPVGSGTLPGDYYYEDWNGDGQINGDDNHPIGSRGKPVFNYGISANLEWKGIDFNMLWQGAAGVYNEYFEVFNEVGPFNGGAVLDIYMDRWHTEGINDDPWNPHTKWVEGRYPATGHSFTSGTTGIHNTSYIRLKSIDLGYTLPKQWLSKAGVQSLRIYFNVYNLLTFTALDMKLDPERPGGSSEAGYSYPIARTFNVGASLKF